MHNLTIIGQSLQNLTVLNQNMHYIFEQRSKWKWYTNKYTPSVLNYRSFWYLQMHNFCYVSKQQCKSMCTVKNYHLEILKQSVIQNRWSSKQGYITVPFNLTLYNLMICETRGRGKVIICETWGRGKGILVTPGTVSVYYFLQS